MNRREFLAASAGAATVIPSRVLGASGHTPPNDQVNVAIIGCGTQTLRLLMSEWLPRKDLQVVAICDPNTDSDDYRDWSQHGLRNAIRQFIHAPNWGSSTGIRAGRIPAKEIIEGYYAMNRKQHQWTGLKLYSDYREMLTESEGMDAIINITPEHLHGVINIAAMKAGTSVISHKALANTLHEVHQTVQVATHTGVPTHLLALPCSHE